MRQNFILFLEFHILFRNFIYFLEFYVFFVELHRLYLGIPTFPPIFRYKWRKRVYFFEILLIFPFFLDFHIVCYDVEEGGFGDTNGRSCMHDKQERKVSSCDLLIYLSYFVLNFFNDTIYLLYLLNRRHLTVSRRLMACCLFFFDDGPVADDPRINARGK